MVTRLDCIDESIGEVSVNEANILHFLGIIEQQTNQILNNFYHNIPVNDLDAENSDTSDIASPQQQDSIKLQCILGVGPKTPMAVDTMNVNPPKLLDYSSDENSVEDNNDNGCRPLTLDEVKSKMITRIGQKRNKAPKPESQFNGGRRGSILTRRRTTVLVADAAMKMMSRRKTTIGMNHEVK